MEKHIEYAAKIHDCILSMFQEDSEHHIDKEDFNDDANTTAFIHALANAAPALIYGKLTGDNDIDFLGFNHIANRLCFQFSEKEPTPQHL